MFLKKIDILLPYDEFFELLKIHSVEARIDLGWKPDSKLILVEKDGYIKGYRLRPHSRTLPIPFELKKTNEVTTVIVKLPSMCILILGLLLAWGLPALLINNEPVILILFPAALLFGYISVSREYAHLMKLFHDIINN